MIAFLFAIIKMEINKNADQAWFVWETNPWFARGGDHNNGLNAGMFAFSVDNGYAASYLSFRVVLYTIFLK